jgi:hypothetical protein
MVGGAGVYHLVGHGCGGSGRRRAEAVGEGLGFHFLSHDVEGGDYCDGGSRNEGPTCSTGKPHWGVVKKACGVDQYRAPPMDGSKEDGQAGCTGKPYWGAAMKVCGVDQYRAPPMDRSKGSQAGAPTTVSEAQGPAAPITIHVGASTVTGVSKGPTAPAAKPAGALAPAARKGGPTKGWGCVAAVAPAVVTAPTTRSREAAAVA